MLFVASRKMSRVELRKVRASISIDFILLLNWYLLYCSHTRYHQYRDNTMTSNAWLQKRLVMVLYFTSTDYPQKQTLLDVLAVYWVNYLKLLGCIRCKRNYQHRFMYFSGCTSPEQWIPRRRSPYHWLSISLWVWWRPYKGKELFMCRYCFLTNRQTSIKLYFNNDNVAIRHNCYQIKIPFCYFLITRAKFTRNNVVKGRLRNK